jgi:hypothetical protein
MGRSASAPVISAHQNSRNTLFAKRRDYSPDSIFSTDSLNDSPYSRDSLDGSRVLKCSTAVSRYFIAEAASKAASQAMREKLAQSIFTFANTGLTR